MPLLESTSWLTVPLGLTQVIAAEALIPNRFAHSLLTRTACSLSPLSNFTVSGLFSDSSVWSYIPVRLTPKSLSSSQFFFHSSEIKPKSVSVACIVPRIVATRTFLCISSKLSLGLTTTSVKLQKPLGLSIISEQGLQPHS